MHRKFRYIDKQLIEAGSSGHNTLRCFALRSALCLSLVAAVQSPQLMAQSLGHDTAISVTNLSVQGHPGSAAIYIDQAKPTLHWQVKAPLLKDVHISSYQLKVATTRSQLNERVKSQHKKADLVWDPGKRPLDLNSGFSQQYAGPSLQSDKTYYWSVRVFDDKGRISSWSKVDSFQTALLDKNDWKQAQWIGRKQMAIEDRVLPGDEPKQQTGPDGKSVQLPLGENYDTLPLFRKAFRLKGAKADIQKATLYIAGLGHFEASLNGQKIGDQLLAPGWTNYQKEALYVGLDVKNLLAEGDNALGVLLGGGFYFIPAAKGWYKKLLVQYGYPKLICRLSIQYRSGQSQDIVSDGSWQTAKSGILLNSIYGGQLEDARLSKTGWDQPGYQEDGDWRSVVLVTDTAPRLQAQLIDPIKVMQRFTVSRIYKVDKGGKDSGPQVPVYTYDMGQNASAIPVIRIKGKKGDTVLLRPAEIINKDYSVNQKATGKYQLIYILGHDGVSIWRPRFNYTGFRYVEVEGALPKDSANPECRPVLLDMQSWHIRNSAPAAGSFTSSNELFNKTSELINWAIKSNMMSVLTDCPTREKLGWLEQVHLMGSSLRYNWQVAPLMKKALADMRASQTASGLVPEIAPEYTVFTWGGDIFRDSPEWGSSAVILPWYLYEWYGDQSELQKNYDMMQRYVQYIDGQAKAHIVYKGLGDWYDLGPKPPGVSQLTPSGLTATAIYYYDLKIMEKAARLLDKQGDAAKYAAAAAVVQKAFNEKFLKVDKAAGETYYGTGSQTADAMAIYMGLVPPSLADKVLTHLVKGIQENGYKLTAGDIGYRYVLRVLEEGGYSDIIFKMNNRSEVPGYGYQLAHGATALTEAWDARASSSQNHFMLGHLMEWFYSGLLGIRLNLAQDSSSLQQWPAPLVIQPAVVGDLSSAEGSYESVFGSIKSAWQKKLTKQGVSLSLSVEVPVGLSAVVKLPFALEGKKIDLPRLYQTLGVASKVQSQSGVDQNYIALPVGSGVYQINAVYK